MDVCPAAGEAFLEEYLGELSGPGSQRNWLLGWRDITGPALMRTLVSCVIPAAAGGNKFPLVFPEEPTSAYLLHATWSSLSCDYIVRQKMTGIGLSYYILKMLTSKSCWPLSRRNLHKGSYFAMNLILLVSVVAVVDGPSRVPVRLRPLYALA